MYQMAHYKQAERETTKTQKHLFDLLIFAVFALYYTLKPELFCHFTSRTTVDAVGEMREQKVLDIF